MLTRLTVMIILLYVQISSHYIVHLKLTPCQLYLNFKKEAAILLTETGIIAQVMYNTKSTLKFKISLKFKNEVRDKIKI